MHADPVGVLRHVRRGAKVTLTLTAVCWTTACRTGVPGVPHTRACRQPRPRGSPCSCTRSGAPPYRECAGRSLISEESPHLRASFRGPHSPETSNFPGACVSGPRTVGPGSLCEGGNPCGPPGSFRTGAPDLSPPGAPLNPRLSPAPSLSNSRFEPRPDTPRVTRLVRGRTPWESVETRSYVREPKGRPSEDTARVARRWPWPRTPSQGRPVCHRSGL